MTKFLALPVLTVADVTRLVLAFRSDGFLRNRKGMDVVVDGRKAPRGGPLVPRRLQIILDQAATGAPMWRVYVAYQILHPYMAGNGRSGRALWLWQWVRTGEPMPRSFLHQAHYQALGESL